MTVDTWPYTSPARIDSAIATNQCTESNLARVVRVLIRPSVILSLFAVLHFLASLCFWAIGVIIVIRSGPTPAAWLMLAIGAAPAIVIFIASVVNLLRSVRSRRFAGMTVAAIYIISIGLFWYDVSNERSQIQVGIATAEYWDNGGSKNTYFTWWWYNDGWFR